MHSAKNVLHWRLAEIQFNESGIVTVGDNKKQSGIILPDFRTASQSQN